MFHGITKTIRIKENMQVKTLVFKRFSNASWSTPFFFFFYFYFCLSICVSRIIFLTRNILNRSSSNCSIFVYMVIRQQQKKNRFMSYFHRSITLVNFQFALCVGWIFFVWNFFPTYLYSDRKWKLCFFLFKPKYFFWRNVTRSMAVETLRSIND